MFCGTFIRTLKTNNLRFPHSFQKALKGKKLIISLFPEGCLFVCPLTGWKIMSKDILEEGKLLRIENREKLRIIFAEVKKISVNASGEITIPKKLKILAGLKRKRKVVLAGCGDWVEIWSLERWEGEEISWEEGLRILYGNVVVIQPLSEG